MPTEPGKTVHPWEEIAEQLSREYDSVKVAELAQKLNDAMLAEEREKVRQRLGRVARRDISRPQEQKAA